MILCKTLLVFTLAWLQLLAWSQTSSAVISEARLVWSVEKPSPAQAAAGAVVGLPHSWGDIQKDPLSAAWYTAQFDRMDVQLMAVYVEKACTNVEIWVNGSLIGSGGQMQEPITRNCYTPQLFSIAHTLLQAKGNTLTIRLLGHPLSQVAVRPRVASLSVIVLGEESQLRNAYAGKYFANITAPQISCAIMGLMGLFILALSLVRRAQRYLFYYGLLLLVWSILTTRFFIKDVPISHFAYDFLIAYLISLVFFLGDMFVLHFTDLSKVWLTRVMLAEHLILPWLIVWNGPDRLFESVTLVYSVVTFQFIFILAYCFWRGWEKLRKELRVLWPILTISTLLVLSQILVQHGLLPVPSVHLSHYAMPLTFIAIGMRLVQQFVKALSESEQINAVLEQRVAQKTQEITHNYEQLGALRAEQAAQTERNRIAADLHDDLGAKLLSIVQTSTKDDSQERTALMARQALDDMRLSVRGLTAEAATWQTVLADWRSETIERLALAQIAAVWNHPQVLPVGLLNAHLHVQLTRILRESISNVIRHSSAKRCSVDIRLVNNSICLSVEDDGKGLPSHSHSDLGHGLINIERRARKLGGSHRFDAGNWGGARISVSVPWAGTLHDTLQTPQAPQGMP